MGLEERGEALGLECAQADLILFAKAYHATVDEAVGRLSECPRARPSRFLVGWGQNSYPFKQKTQIASSLGQPCLLEGGGFVLISPQDFARAARVQRIGACLGNRVTPKRLLRIPHRRIGLDQYQGRNCSRLVREPSRQGVAYRLKPAQYLQMPYGGCYICPGVYCAWEIGALQWAHQIRTGSTVQSRFQILSLFDAVGRWRCVVLQRLAAWQGLAHGADDAPAWAASGGRRPQWHARRKRFGAQEFGHVMPTGLVGLHD